MVKKLRAILTLPFMVTVVIPLVLLLLTGGITICWALDPPLFWLIIVIAVLIAAYGLSLMVRTIQMFIAIGRGTLAP